MADPLTATTPERLAPPMVKFADPVHMFIHIVALAVISLVVVPVFLGAPNMIHSIWFVVIMLTSTTFHEIGHAVAGVSRGQTATIRLTWCGAVTDFDDGEESALHAVICDIAGPLTGALFGLLLWQAEPHWPLGAVTAVYGSWIFWLNLADLLPVLPGNDGWQACTTLIDKARGRVR